MNIDEIRARYQNCLARSVDPQLTSGERATAKLELPALSAQLVKANQEEGDKFIGDINRLQG